MNRFHPIYRAVEIPHAYDVEVAEKCLAHMASGGVRSPTLGGGYHTYIQVINMYLFFVIKELFGIGGAVFELYWHILVVYDLALQAPHGGLYRHIVW